MQLLPLRGPLPPIPLRFCPFPLSGFMQTSSLAAEENSDKKRQTAVVAEWGKKLANTLVEAKKTPLQFPGKLERTAAISLIHDLLAIQLVSGKEGL